MIVNITQPCCTPSIWKNDISVYLYGWSSYWAWLVSMRDLLFSFASVWYACVFVFVSLCTCALDACCIVATRSIERHHLFCMRFSDHIQSSDERRSHHHINRMQTICKLNILQQRYAKYVLYLVGKRSVYSHKGYKVILLVDTNRNWFMKLVHVHCPIDRIIWQYSLASVNMRAQDLGLC